jgi:transcription initiation factor IIE alpha subunit
VDPTEEEKAEELRRKAAEQAKKTQFVCSKGHIHSSAQEAQECPRA